MNFKQMMEMQKEYNDEIVGNDLTQTEIERVTQENVLCAHAELSALVNATHYKNHHTHSEPIANKSTVLYESVDVIRYMMAILNTWNITSEDFENAFKKKDVYLQKHKELQSKEWNGVQPVAIVDIDDVLANFREGFSKWLKENYGVEADVNSKEYYFITALSKIHMNSETVFKRYLDDGGFANLTIDTDNLGLLHQLKNQGYWIHLLTARPEEELQCLYDTYYWIWEQCIPCDAISFSPEKFRWCAKSKYYDAGKIMFAIDDAPKHAEDYAKHGIKCLVPSKSYNDHLDHKNIYLFDNYYKAIGTLSELGLLKNGGSNDLYDFTCD